MQVVNESKCDILILLILSINFTYLLNLRQSDAEHTPRLRATLFSALFYYPNSHTREEMKNIGKSYIGCISAIVPIISKLPNLLFFLSHS